jgi:UDP-N-acetylglucosamine transferase subunit ALG13
VILVTVGAQMPFDRLVKAVDEWAGAEGRTDVFAQIGPDAYVPRHIQHTPFLEPNEFRSRVESADVIVSHAGMGSILTALQAGKPILVMPRRGDLRETRNDHQVATAERFGASGTIAVAMDATELASKLSSLASLGSPEPIAPHASDELIAALRGFILGEQP